MMLQVGMKPSFPDGGVGKVVDEVSDFILLPDSDSVDCLELH